MYLNVIATLFITAKEETTQITTSWVNGKQNTVGYYLAIRRDKLTHAAVWVDLKTFAKRKKPHTKDHMI